MLFHADTPAALAETSSGYSALFSSEGYVGYVHDATTSLEYPPVALVASADKRALFLSEMRGDERLGAIADHGADGWASFAIGSDAALTLGPDFACANAPVHADAIGTADGWLVLTGNDDSQDDCDAILDEGPPRNVQILAVSSAGSEAEVTLLHEESTTSNVERVAIVDAAEGAWVAWHTGDSVWAMRVGAEGEVLVPAFALDAPIGPPSAWDITATDDGFVHTQVRTDPGQVLSSLALTVVDDAGTVLAQQSFDLDITVGPAASALFHGDTQSLVVATTAIGEGFDSSSHVVVAKLDCSDGP